MYHMHTCGSNEYMDVVYFGGGFRFGVGFGYNHHHYESHIHLLHPHVCMWYIYSGGFTFGDGFGYTYLMFYYVQTTC